MAFHDIRFPETISYGSSGSPSYRTEVVVLENGHEDIALLSDEAIYEYDVAFGVKTLVQLQEVHTFFLARQGRSHTFRFKDWLDFTVSQSPIVVTGMPTLQLTKRYTSGSQSYDRKIRKPIDPITMRRNTSPFSSFTLNDMEGIITLTPDFSRVIEAGSLIGITNISQANPGVVTTGVAHGLSTGYQMRLQSVGGMVEVNGLDVIVTVIDPTNFSIGIDTTNFTAYTSGGDCFNVGMSRENPGVVRCVAHGYSTDDVIFQASVEGMVEANDLLVTITNIDADHFSIGIDTTNFSLFTGTALAQKFIQPSEALDWSGEFDVPVRFDADRLPAIHNAFDIGAIQSIPLIEKLRD